MSDLGTLIMAWAAVHATIAIHNLAVHLRRPTDLEYLAYSALSLGFAIYTAGAALLTEAASVADGAAAARLGWVGAPIAMGAFVAFASLLFNRPNTRVLAGATLWAAIGLFLTLSGLFFDPEIAAAGSPYREPVQTEVAALWVVGACCFLSWALVQVLRHFRTDRDLRLVGLGAVILVVASIHDQGIHFGVIPGHYWVEHAAIPVTLIFSFMLLRRLAATESELERRTAEVRESYLDLQRAQAELIQKEQLAAVGELSAVIAHEIRNPLAILTNAASGLKKRRLSPDDRQTLLTILAEEADRLGRLAHDLGTYAQPIVPERVLTSVSQLLEEAGQRASRGAHEDLVVRLSLRDDIDEIEGDPELLQRALESVVANAVQAMPAGGELALRTKRVELNGAPAVCIVISDQGEGMNTLVQDKALDPFFTTRASGTGLGLAIVDRIVRAHGGVLALESDYGQGTTVRITLPRVP